MPESLKVALVLIVFLVIVIIWGLSDNAWFKSLGSFDYGLEDDFEDE